MAIDGFTVFGPAVVSVGTGSSGALETLGYTENGVDVDVQEFREPVMTDVMGPSVPHDHQNFGMVARLSIPLIAVDRAVWAKIQGRGDRTSAGLISTPGSILGGGAAVGASGNYYFRTGIAAALDTPYSFNACMVQPGYRFRMATKANPWVLSLFAFPYALYTVTAAKDTPLFTRSLS